MAAVDRELLAMGLGSASACLFRRCHACLVPRPGSDIAALRASRVGLEARYSPCAVSRPVLHGLVGLLSTCALRVPRA